MNELEQAWEIIEGALTGLGLSVWVYLGGRKVAQWQADKKRREQTWKQIDRQSWEDWQRRGRQGEWVSPKSR